MTTIRCRLPSARRGPRPAAPRRRESAVTEPTRAARMLALAHHLDRLVEAGDLPDYAAAATALGVTRARLSQVLALLLLAPDIQERVLVGDLCASERDLRPVARTPCWADQRGIQP